MCVCVCVSVCVCLCVRARSCTFVCLDIYKYIFLEGVV